MTVTFVGVTIFWKTASLRHLPKDDALARIFSGHRAAFEKVVAMVREDGDLEFITVNEAARKLDLGTDGKWMPKKQIPLQRENQYQQLLREIGIKDMVSIWPPKQQVMFYLYSDALATKGICYWDKNPSEEPFGTMFTNLDNLKKLPQQDGHVMNGVYLRPIEGPWCVFLYWKD